MVAEKVFLVFIDEVAKCFYINNIQVRGGGDVGTAGKPVPLRKKEQHNQADRTEYDNEIGEGHELQIQNGCVEFS
jgi:hypothetical protein